MPSETYEAVHPDQYPIHGGFPYLNLARWYDIDYAEVLNHRTQFPNTIRNHIMNIASREYKRAHGFYGPLTSYGV
jgi:hypothetical protein